MPKTDNPAFDQLEQRITANYNEALKKSIKRYKELFKKIQKIDSGEIRPPAAFDPRLHEDWKNGSEVQRKAYAELVKKFDRWRRDYIQKITHQAGVIDNMAEELARAGENSNQKILESLSREYVAEYKKACGMVEAEAARAGLQYRFAMPTDQELRILLDNTKNRPLSKIAFAKSEDINTIGARLQDQFMQSILRGESQTDLVRRIRKETQFQAWRSRSIAQTETKRIQSEARYNQGEVAKSMGIREYNEWSCYFLPPDKHGRGGSRQSHQELHGQKRLQGEPFETKDGVKIMFPGDPSAPAGEVINCHCVLIKHVLLPWEDLIDGKVVVNEEEKRRFDAGQNYRQDE